MAKQSNLYSIGFAFVICVLGSLLLSTVSSMLRERQELNESVDIKKHILDAVRLTPPLTDKISAREVDRIYNEVIRLEVIDAQGNPVPDRKPESIRPGEKLYLLYVYHQNNAVQGYCFPVEGKGLWAMIYGYLAIEPDGKTVRGITFTKQGETPGLGAEIETMVFRKRFEGKKIWDAEAGRAMPVALVKGKVQDKFPREKWPYYVDGISGATLTGEGVNALLANWLKIYEPFFARLRN